MAKTSSEIIEENQKKRAEEKKIEESRNAIHQKQMAGVEDKAAARTAAVLDGTSDKLVNNKQSTQASESAETSTTSEATTKEQASKKKQDLQYEKEVEQEEKKKKKEVEDKKQKAQKEYEDYLNSEEHKKNLEEASNKALIDAAAQATFNPNFDIMQSRVVEDEKEAQLRAAKEQAEIEYNRYLDEQVMAADQVAITDLSDEERSQLEQYAVNRIRDQNQTLEMKGIAPTAQQEAASLIQKYGQQRVDELAETLMRQQNEDLAKTVDEKSREFANNQGIAASALTVPVAAVSGLVGTVGQLQGAARNTGRYRTLDGNETGTMGDVFTGAVRGQVQENIEEDLGGGFLGKAASIGYQGVMDAADSIARAYMGGGALGGAGLAAMNSFSQTMAEASRNGATPGQAALLATVNSGIEAASEAIPLDDLIKSAKGSGAGTLIKNALRQAGIEATTEEISLVGTVLAEMAIMQEKSSYQQEVREHILNGDSPETARAKANQTILNEALNTALVSGMSGEMAVIGGKGADIVANKFGAPKPQTIQETLDAWKGDTQQEAAQNPAEALNAEQNAGNSELTGPELISAMGLDEIINSGGRVTNDIAEQILRDPEVLDIIMRETMTELTGSRAAQREQIKNAIYQIAGIQTEPAAATQSAPVQQPQTQEAQPTVNMAQQNTRNDLQEKNSVYGELQREKALQKDLQRQIAKTEEKVNTGKGSPARLAQLKAELEQQNKRVNQLQSQYDYFGGDYDTNVKKAAQTQQAVFEQARQEAVAAKEAYNEGRISKAQYDAAQQKYNTAGRELYRLKNMTQEQYAAELSSVGLIADRQPAGVTPMREQPQQNANPVPVQQQKQATEASEQAIKQASAPQMDMQMGASNQSPQGGQIMGTGAAEVNFSGKPAYNATLSEDNAQADRRTDVRPMELPATDINGANISATTGNVYGSQNTPDDLAAAMEEPAARGDFSYIRISNDTATQRAQQTIEQAGGWEAARDNFRMDVDRGNAGAELSARGALILNHAAEVYEQAKASGDVQAAQRAKQEWLTILSDVQKLGTNTAQGLQALKIIRNMMPQDKMQFAKIAVQNMVRDMGIKTDIQIDDRLVTEYENATTDEQRNEVMEKIQQNVADQIPSTMLDKGNALRYTNMLGNLKTTVRNIGGNVGNSLAYRIKDSTAAAIEAIANKVTKGKVGRTKSVVVNRGLQKACGDYFDQVKTAVSSGGKYGENNTASTDFGQSVMDKRRIFKSNAKNDTVRKVADVMLAPMEAYRKGTDWMMNNKYFGDEAFGKASFTHAMAGYLQANGVKTATDIQNADPALIDKAVAYAVREAQETTFHDNSALANILGKVKKNTGIVGEGIMPFTKTPANVLVRAEEMSPLGIINTAVTAVRAANPNSDITGVDVINSLAKTLTGTGIFVLGAIMKSQGLLNGGPDDDDEKAAFDKENGIQPYSINLPDGSTYTLDWLTPEAMPLFMGAEFMDIASGKELTFADMEKIFTSIADPMIQMSMMQGINRSLDSIKHSGNNMGQFFINAAVSYLTQGLTNTLMGQLERSTEDYRQTTYTDPESGVPVWAQQQLGSASQKIPGWDYQQSDYRDSFGQKQENEGGLLYDLASPGYKSKVDVDDVDKELYRLDEAGIDNVFPEKADTKVKYTDKNGEQKEVQLDTEQYQTYSETQGQVSYEMIKDLIDSDDYDAMTDEQKAEAINDIYAYAKMTGEIAAVGDSHTGYEDPWMMDVKENGTDEIVQRTFESSLTTAAEGLSNAWEKGYDEDSFIREMESAYSSYKKATPEMKKKLQESLGGNAEIYVAARDYGLSSEETLEVQKAIADVSKQGQKMEVIASNTSLTEKEKKIMGMLYGSDAQDKNIKEVASTVKRANIEGKKTPEIGDFELYTQLYQDHENYTKGTGKKKRTMQHWMQTYGIDYDTAKALYEVFS